MKITTESKVISGELIRSPWSSLNGNNLLFFIFIPLFNGLGNDGVLIVRGRAKTTAVRWIVTPVIEVKPNKDKGVPAVDFKSRLPIVIYIFYIWRIEWRIILFDSHM